MSGFCDCFVELKNFVLSFEMKYTKVRRATI